MDQSPFLFLKNSRLKAGAAYNVGVVLIVGLNLRSINVAVQKNRKTPSKRGMRRAHDALRKPTLSVDPSSGETHRRHHITPEGYYRGKRIVASKIESEDK
jgi:large subunit ribosomal protein L32